MRSRLIEKIGTVGAFLAAAACPACFPILAVAGTAVGLGIFRPFGQPHNEWKRMTMAEERSEVPDQSNGEENLKPDKNPAFNQLLLYLGLVGLAAASILNFFANRKCAQC